MLVEIPLDAHCVARHLSRYASEGFPIELMGKMLNNRGEAYRMQVRHQKPAGFEGLRIRNSLGFRPLGFKPAGV